jgi:FkbM family methyltransferase
LPAFKVGTANVFDKPFKFHDGKNFVSTYKELFKDRIYQFKPSNTDRTILDCGANMGLSVLFFASNYPEHRIIAFEPDPSIFKILQENVETFGLENVTLHERAVWDKEETLTFFTDRGMGGRVENAYAGQQPELVKTVRLRDFIKPGVDFLKIDIEGAEGVVMADCKDKLSIANHIFFEYHNDITKSQTLHELLGLVKDQGFHYYIKESFTRDKPFTDSRLVCEVFDMAINVFCYKN